MAFSTSSSCRALDREAGEGSSSTRKEYGSWNAQSGYQDAAQRIRGQLTDGVRGGRRFARVSERCALFLTVPM